MSTYSGILAWKISRTEEPGELQSMGPQRVRCDWAYTHTHTQRSPPCDPHGAATLTTSTLKNPMALVWNHCINTYCGPSPALQPGPLWARVKIVSHEKRGQGRAFPTLPALALEHSLTAGSKHTNNPRLSWRLFTSFKYGCLYNVWHIVGIQQIRTNKPPGVNILSL